MYIFESQSVSILGIIGSKIVQNDSDDYTVYN